MTIHAAARSQSCQLVQSAADLRRVRTALCSHQHNLNAHWQGTDMIPKNQAFDDYVRRLALVANELEIISKDIIREAKNVRIEDQLAMKGLAHGRV